MQTDIEQSADRLKAAARRGFTWHTLSQTAAKIMLALAFALWVRVYWIDIRPQIDRGVDGAPTTDGVLAFVLDAALVGGLAFASATVPPIFLSSLVADSPADVVLNRVRMRVGKIGFMFAMAGAVALSFNSLIVLVAFWQSRTLIPTSDLFQADNWTVWRFAAATLLLMVGFPAWALNKMAPEQWVDAMIQAREAMRIQRIIDLEEAAGRALITKLHAQLMADTATMTLHERAQNNAEVAAILAASERAFARSLRMIGHTFKSLTGMDVHIQTENDQAITARYQHIVNLFDGAASVSAQTATYAGALIDAPTQPSIALPDAEMDGSVDADGRPNDPSVADHHGPPRTMDDSLEIARRHFGDDPWNRAGLQVFFANCSKSKAAQMIMEWKEDGVVHELTEPAYTYVFVQEVR